MKDTTTTADQHQKDRSLRRPVVTFQGLHEKVATLEERLSDITTRLDTAERWMKSVDDRLSGIPASIDEILQILNRADENKTLGSLPPE
jgi:wobble nucleotide-excising tRNase